MENEDEDDELCIASAVVVAVVAIKKEDGHAYVGFTNDYLIDHNLGHMLL